MAVLSNTVSAVWNLRCKLVGDPERENTKSSHISHRRELTRITTFFSRVVSAPGPKPASKLGAVKLPKEKVPKQTSIAAFFDETSSISQATRSTTTMYQRSQYPCPVTKATTQVSIHSFYNEITVQSTKMPLPCRRPTVPCRGQTQAMVFGVRLQKKTSKGPTVDKPLLNGPQEGHHVPQPVRSSARLARARTRKVLAKTRLATPYQGEECNGESIRSNDAAASPSQVLSKLSAFSRTPSKIYNNKKSSKKSSDSSLSLDVSLNNSNPVFTCLNYIPATVAIDQVLGEHDKEGIG